MPRLIHLSKSCAIDLDSDGFKTDGFRAYINGEPGSGKSNAGMLITEQWIQHGLQAVVFDSHGELGELWRLRPANISRFGYGDEHVKLESVEWVMSEVRQGNTVLIDLSHWADVEISNASKFTYDLATELLKYKRKTRGHMLMHIEEAQNIAPQKQSSAQYDTIKLIGGIQSGGRKFGLHTLMSTQRRSLIDSDIVALCNLFVYMRISDLADWDKMKKLLPPKFPLEYRTGNPKRDITKFVPGEAVMLSRWFDPTRQRLNLCRTPVTKFTEEQEDVE